MERQTASLLFATPPTSSYEEALGFLVKCNTLATTNPQFQGVVTQNCLLMGQCYEALKKIPEAKQWYEKCIASGGTTKGELESVELAKQKLATLGQSGYFW